MSKRHIVESITSWRAKIATGGGNILAFWRPWPPSDSTEWEQENHCLLYGHLGGVMYLTTNTLGDTLVSVGQDRVAKLWRAKPQISHNSPAVLQPVRQHLISLSLLILEHFASSEIFSKI